MANGLIGAALLATAIFPLAAYGETKITSTYDSFAQSWSTNAVDHRGLTTEIAGRYGSGLWYDLSHSFGEFKFTDGETINAQGAELQVGYIFGNLIGPSVSYQWWKQGDES